MNATYLAEHHENAVESSGPSSIIQKLNDLRDRLFDRLHRLMAMRWKLSCVIGFLPL